MKAAGFSLIEVLVATAVVIVGVASLAQLLVVSADANRIAAAASTSLLLAERRMEELLGETASGPTPPGALSASTPGYVDLSRLERRVARHRIGPAASGHAAARDGLHLPLVHHARCRIARLPRSSFRYQSLHGPYRGQARLVSVKSRTAG